MLTKEEIAENREWFLEFCKKNIKREGVDDFLTWLDSTDFFTAPASTKFHGNYEGGLCEHSLNVYQALSDIHSLYCGEFSLETIGICALFHDVCKANMYKRGTRNVKGEDGKWTTKEVWEIDDHVPLGHGEKSALLILRYMSLTLDELYAIRWHMGGFDNAVKGGDYSLNKAQEKSVLVPLLHSADLIATSLFERKSEN